jgi:tripartite-type tricarboxylate transporter receptor subunit TctC
MKLENSKTNLMKKTLMLTLLVSCAAFAQNYPDKNIKIMQGFAPGGNADAIARTVGSEISKSVGQPVVVEAQAGAGGTIAATTVAKAKPDASDGRSCCCRSDLQQSQLQNCSRF